MTSFRITLTALLLAAAGIAQASEMSEGPTPASTKERVAVDARTLAQTNEIWDGTQGTKATASTKSREQVRQEAAAAQAMTRQLALRDYLGGM